MFETLIFSLQGILHNICHINKCITVVDEIGKFYYENIIFSILNIYFYHYFVSVLNPDKSMINRRFKGYCDVFLDLLYYGICFLEEPCTYNRYYHRFKMRIMLYIRPVYYNLKYKRFLTIYCFFIIFKIVKKYLGYGVFKIMYYYRL